MQLPGQCSGMCRTIGCGCRIQVPITGRTGTRPRFSKVILQMGLLNGIVEKRFFYVIEPTLLRYVLALKKTLTLTL